jgi:hypothetical protein
MFARLGHAIPLILFAASGALAQEACSDGLANLLSVEGYDVAPKDLSYSTGIDLKVSLRNTGDKAVRMIDGGIIFQDVLDRDILRIAIEPDLRIEAGAIEVQQGLYTNDRLLDVDEADVIVTACVEGVVFSDGEVLKAGS